MNAAKPTCARTSPDLFDPSFESLHELTILSSNCTSWECHADCLLHSGADILLLQEVRLAAEGIASQTKKLSQADEPWSSVWGRPPGIIKVKGKRLAKSCTGKSVHGGVGILSKRPTPLVSTGFNTFPGHSLHESTRWCAAAIPLGPQGALSRCFLHLISFYGIANRAQGAKQTQNERLLKQVFEHASSLGQQAVPCYQICPTLVS